MIRAMLQYKIIICIYFFCTFFQLSIYGQPLDYPIPYNTSLIDKTINRTKTGDIYLLEYNSTLSKENILDFYRDNLAKENIKEINYNKNKNLPEETFIFEGTLRRIVIFFVASYNDQATDYYVLVHENSYLPNPEAGQNVCKSCLEGLKNKTIKLFENISFPHKIDFMPLYPDTKEVEYVNWPIANPPMISIGYLTKSDSAQVIEFYLENMPKFGWELIDRQPRDGMYEASDWVKIVAPETYCAHHPCANILPEPIPPLKLRGETLTFEREDQRCIVTIHTFDDIVAKSKGTIYDLSVVEENGNTAIGVAYFY